MGGIGGQPAEAVAKVASFFGNTDDRREVEPGAFEKQLGLVGLGARLLDAGGHEAVGSLHDLCQELSIGVVFLELELISVEPEDRQARSEPVRRAGVDGGPQFLGSFAV